MKSPVEVDPDHQVEENPNAVLGVWRATPVPTAVGQSPNLYTFQKKGETVWAVLRAYIVVLAVAENPKKVGKELIW